MLCPLTNWLAAMPRAWVLVCPATDKSFRYQCRNVVASLFDSVSKSTEAEPVPEGNHCPSCWSLKLKRPLDFGLVRARGRTPARLQLVISKCPKLKAFFSMFVSTSRRVINTKTKCGALPIVSNSLEGWKRSRTDRIFIFNHLDCFAPACTSKAPAWASRAKFICIR